MCRPDQIRLYWSKLIASCVNIPREVLKSSQDNKFASIREYLLPLQLLVYGKDEHVGVIERAMRVIKERCRRICHAVPYKYYTKHMLRSLIAVVISVDPRP